jgi:hypothetical protein
MYVAAAIPVFAMAAGGSSSTAPEATTTEPTHTDGKVGPDAVNPVDKSDAESDTQSSGFTLALALATDDTDAVVGSHAGWQQTRARI